MKSILEVIPSKYHDPLQKAMQSVGENLDDTPCLFNLYAPDDWFITTMSYEYSPIPNGNGGVRKITQLN